jgi:hypothetical protein
MSIINRRATLGTLIRSARPMSIEEVSRSIVQTWPVRWPDAPPSRRAIAEILRWQERKGVVRRLDRGVYVFASGSVSRTTAWRYASWERWFDERYDVGRVPQPPIESVWDEAAG